MARLCSTVGVLNYPNQVEKRSTASTDSPIYSTINTTAAEDDLLAYYDTYSSAPYNQGPDPYSSNPILANSGLVGLEQDLDHWTIQSGQSGSEYAKLQYCKKNKGEETPFRFHKQIAPDLIQCAEGGWLVNNIKNTHTFCNIF